VKSNDNLAGTFDTKLFGPHPIVTSGQQNSEARFFSNLEAIRNSEQGINENPVGALIGAMEDRQNSGLFRPEIPKYLISLSDTDQLTLSASETYNKIVRAFSGLRWHFTAITSPENSPCMDAEDPYPSWILSFVRFPQTNALSLSNQRPTDGIIDPASFNVKIGNQSISPGTTNGYSWDPTQNNLTFYGTAIPLPRETLEVNYDVLRP
jgi:hypothetical protein